jgi:hypothetical protein
LKLLLSFKKYSQIATTYYKILTAWITQGGTQHSETEMRR